MISATCCPERHTLRRFRIQDVYFCSKCEEIVQSGEFMFTCFADDYDLCTACYEASVLADEGTQQVLERLTNQHSRLLTAEELELKWEEAVVVDKSTTCSLEEAEAMLRELVLLSRCAGNDSASLAVQSFRAAHWLTKEKVFAITTTTATNDMVPDSFLSALCEFVACFAFARDLDLASTATDLVLALPTTSTHTTLDVLSCLVSMANYHVYASDSAVVKFLLEHARANNQPEDLFAAAQAPSLEAAGLALHALGNLALHRSFTFPPGFAQFVSFALMLAAGSGATNPTTTSAFLLQLGIRIIYSYCTSKAGDEDAIVRAFPLQLALIAERYAGAHEDDDLGGIAEYALNRLTYLTSQPEFYDVVFKQRKEKGGEDVPVSVLFRLAIPPPDASSSSADVRALAWENLAKAEAVDLFRYTAERDELIGCLDGGETGVIIDSRLNEALTFLDALVKTNKANRLALCCGHDAVLAAVVKVANRGGYHVLCALSVDSPERLHAFPGLVDDVLATLRDTQVDEATRERAGGVLENMAGCTALKTPLFQHPKVMSTLLELIPLHHSSPSSSPSVALRCVRTLGFLSWENCVEIFRVDGLMPVLMDTIAAGAAGAAATERNEFPDLVEQAANVIGNLALEDELRAPLFNYAGLLPQVISLLLSPDPGSTKSSLLRVLQQVSIPFKFESLRYPRMGEMLVHLLSEDYVADLADVELKQECLEFCCHLSCEQRNKAPMLHLPGLFSSLVRCLAHAQQHRELGKNALITIAHLAWENRVEIAEFPQLLERVVDCLQLDKMEPAVTDHAATICNNLALEQENHDRLFTFPGLVPALLNACVLAPPELGKVTRRWANASLVALTTLSPTNCDRLLANKPHMSLLLNAVYDGELTELLGLLINLGLSQEQMADFVLSAHSMVALLCAKLFPRTGARARLVRSLPLHLVRDLALYLY